MGEGKHVYIGVGQDGIVTSFFGKLYDWRPGERDRSKHGT